jgi:hypothetical protein
MNDRLIGVLALTIALAIACTLTVLALELWLWTRRRKQRAVGRAMAVRSMQKTSIFSQPNVTYWHLFHHLWSKAVGTPDYAKEEWRTLEELVLQSSFRDKRLK